MCISKQALPQWAGAGDAWKEDGGGLVGGSSYLWFSTCIAHFWKGGGGFDLGFGHSLEALLGFGVRGKDLCGRGGLQGEAVGGGLGAA